MLGWELPPHNSGGLGVACLYLSKALAANGLDIDFVVPYSADHSSITHMQILPATKLDPLYKYSITAYDQKVIEQIIPSESRHTNYSIRDIQHLYCQFVDQYLCSHKPALVHAHDWLTYEAGILAKKRHNIPLVAHVHATEFDRAGMSSGNPLIHSIEYQGLLHADKILAVSENTKNLIHKKYHIPLSKIDIAYNSLGSNFLNGNYQFSDANYNYFKTLKSSGYTIISTVGRFTMQKGLFNMMRAAALALQKHNKLLFIFAGDGEQREELIRLASDLDISDHVIFTGFIRGKKLRDIYNISDIFVMSSISEPFGLTALEAAHHGNALILTKQSGVSEILYSIMSYDFWDEQKLADQILAIAKSPKLKTTLQENIKKEYNRISWDDVAKKCLKVYDDIKKHKRDPY